MATASMPAWRRKKSRPPTEPGPTWTSVRKPAPWRPSRRLPPPSASWRGPGASEASLTDYVTESTQKHVTVLKNKSTWLERQARAQLETARTAGAEDVAETAGGLAETRGKQVVGVAAEIGGVQQVEGFGEDLPFHALAEAEELGHAQILRVEYVPGREVLGQCDGGEDLRRVGALLAAVGLVVLIHQIHRVAFAQAESELVGAGAGEQELVDSGAVEIGSGDDGLEGLAAVEAGNERHLHAAWRLYHAGDIQHMAGRGGSDVLHPVVQVGDGRVQLVESVNVPVALQGVGNADRMAVAETLVGAHQEGFVSAVAAADGGLYGAVGARHTGHGGERRRAGRDDGAAYRGVVVEIDAAQHFVDVVAEGEIGGDGEIAGHLALHAEREVLRLGGDKIGHEEVAGGFENVDVAHREIGVVGVDIELLDGAGANQGQDGGEQVAGEGGGDADIERRSVWQAGNAGDGVGNDGAGQRQIARAERAQVGALHQAGFDIERVVEDAAAAADHGAVIGQAPGEAGGGSEAQVSVPLVAQAAGAEDGGEIRGLGEVVVERVAFERPGQAIVESQVRAQLPGVLPVKVEETVVVGLAALEGGGLIDVADAEDEVFQGEAEDIDRKSVV